MSQTPKPERKGEPMSGDRQQQDKNKKTQGTDDPRTQGNKGKPQPVQGDEDESMDDESMDDDQPPQRGQGSRQKKKDDYTG